MFGKDSKITNFINVKRADLANKFHRQRKLAPMPNDVFVSSKTTQCPQMSKEEVENKLKAFLENDPCKISERKEIFDNLDKVDLNNAEVHLKNICTLLAGASNDDKEIMQNGYFSSDRGAEAFSILAEKFDNKSKRGWVSPLSTILANYKPEAVLVLQERGLIEPDKMQNYDRFNKLAAMSDEEFISFQTRVEDSIKATGLTFEELANSLKQEVGFLVNSYCFKTFQKYCLNKEQVVAQKELLPFIKDCPVTIEDDSIISILLDVDIDNIELFKNIFSRLKERNDIPNGIMVYKILSIANKENESILINLLQEKGIPFEKIVQYCNNDDFKKGLLSIEDVIKNINNDPFIKSVQAIKSAPIDLKPTNANPTKLTPHNIQPDALALVHLTKYEPTDGVIYSTRDKIGGSRNSVHFTLNHAVSGHRNGCWDESPIAIIMPYTSTVEKNGNKKFIEGMPNELYTNGSVKIPEGAIIMKHDSELPEGTINIKEHPSIKGVKLIETSELPHSLIPTVIKKMGYTHMQGDAPIGLFSYGEKNGKTIDAVMDNFVAWKEFCEANNLKATRHTGSAGDIAEKIIENIGKLCVNNSWHNGGNKNINYKEILFTYIDYVKNLQQKGYFASYDLDVLKNIIEESPTPEDAVKKMPEKLGFHPTLTYKHFSDCDFHLGIDIYSQWYAIEDSIDDVRKYIYEHEMDF